MKNLHEDLNAVIEYGDEFKALYTSAMVGKTEVLVSKGSIILPLFVACSTDESVLDDKILPVIIPDEALKGTGYSNFEFAGLPLNAESHYSFWKYINALSQKAGNSRITVNVREMLAYIGKKNNDFNTYNNYFAKFLERIRHTRIRYTVRSVGYTVDSNLIGDFVDLGDGVYIINLGRYMIESLLKDKYTRKLRINKPKNIHAGTSYLLYSKLDVLIYGDFGEVSVDLLFTLLGIKNKNINYSHLSTAEAKRKRKADRDANFKPIKKAIANLHKIGFIATWENIVKGKSVVGYKFYLNRDFNVDLTDDLDFMDQRDDDDVFTFDQEPTVTVLPAPAVAANVEVIENPMAAFESIFAKIGRNPEAIEHEKVMAERMRKDVQEKSVASLTNAMARKAQK